MRLAEKEVSIDAQGRRRVRRRYDDARTPFDRLCDTKVLSPMRQEQLAAMRKRTNPRQLIQEIHALIGQILELPGAIEGKTEDIFRTLLTPSEEQRLKWAVGYVDKSETASGLPTYPLLCPSGYSLDRLLPAGRNGKTEKPNPLRLKKTR